MDTRHIQQNTIHLDQQIVVQAAHAWLNAPLKYTSKIFKHSISIQVILLNASNPTTFTMITFDFEFSPGPVSNPTTFTMITFDFEFSPGPV